MATTTYSVLGQVNPASATLTTLYTCPAATSAIGSTMVIANQSTSTTVRVAVRKSGAAIDPKHYIVYDTYVNANESLFLTLGITLATTDVVSVYAGTASVSFSLFGTELT